MHLRRFFCGGNTASWTLRDNMTQAAFPKGGLGEDERGGLWLGDVDIIAPHVDHGGARVIASVRG